MRVILSFSIICLFSLFVFSVNQNVFAANDTATRVPLVDSENLSVLAIILAFSSIAAVIVGSYQTWKQLKIDADDKFTRLLIELDDQLTDHIKTEQGLKTKDDCEYYICVYMDLVVRITFLEKTRRISDDMTIYFAYYFQYALAMKKWYVEKAEPTYPMDHYLSRWKKIDEWCNNSRKAKLVDSPTDKIEPYPDDILPYALLNYHDLPEKELQ